MTKNRNRKRLVRARMQKTGESYQAALRQVAGGGDGRGRTFEQVVEVTIRLAQLAATEDQAESEERDVYTVGELLHLTLQRSLGRGPPAERALHEHLLRLSTDELRKLRSVMYAGRDQRTLASLRGPLSDETDHDGLASQIGGKCFHLARYLRAGLAIAMSEVDVDVDYSSWFLSDHSIT